MNGRSDRDVQRSQGKLQRTVGAVACTLLFIVVGFSGTVSASSPLEDAAGIECEGMGKALAGVCTAINDLADDGGGSEEPPSDCEGDVELAADGFALPCTDIPPVFEEINALVEQIGGEAQPIVDDCTDLKAQKSSATGDEPCTTALTLADGVVELVVPLITDLADDGLEEIETCLNHFGVEYGTSSSTLNCDDVNALILELIGHVNDLIETVQAQVDDCQTETSSTSADAPVDCQQLQRDVNALQATVVSTAMAAAALATATIEACSDQADTSADTPAEPYCNTAWGLYDTLISEVTAAVAAAGATIQSCQEGVDEYSTSSETQAEPAYDCAGTIRLAFSELNTLIGLGMETVDTVVLYADSCISDLQGVQAMSEGPLDCSIITEQIELAVKTVEATLADAIATTNDCLNPFEAGTIEAPGTDGQRVINCGDYVQLAIDEVDGTIGLVASTVASTVATAQSCVNAVEAEDAGTSAGEKHPTCVYAWDQAQFVVDVVADAVDLAVATIEECIASTGEETTASSSESTAGSECGPTIRAAVLAVEGAVAVALGVVETARVLVQSCVNATSLATGEAHPACETGWATANDVLDEAMAAVDFASDTAAACASSALAEVASSSTAEDEAVVDCGAVINLGLSTARAVAEELQGIVFEVQADIEACAGYFIGPGTMSTGAPAACGQAAGEVDDGLIEVERQLESARSLIEDTIAYIVGLVTACVDGVGDATTSSTEDDELDCNGQTALVIGLVEQVVGEVLLGVTYLVGCASLLTEGTIEASETPRGVVDCQAVAQELDDAKGEADKVYGQALATIMDCIAPFQESTTSTDTPLFDCSGNVNDVLAAIFDEVDVVVRLANDAAAYVAYCTSAFGDVQPSGTFEESPVDCADQKQAIDDGIAEGEALARQVEVTVRNCEDGLNENAGTASEDEYLFECEAFVSGVMDEVGVVVDTVGQVVDLVASTVVTCVEGSGLAAGTSAEEEVVVECDPIWSNVRSAVRTVGDAVNGTLDEVGACLAHAAVMPTMSAESELGAACDEVFSQIYWAADLVAYYVDEAVASALACAGEWGVAADQPQASSAADEEETCAALASQANATLGAAQIAVDKAVTFAGQCMDSLQSYEAELGSVVPTCVEDMPSPFEFVPGACEDSSEMALSLSGESTDPCALAIDPCEDLPGAVKDNPVGCQPIYCDISEDGPAGYCSPDIDLCSSLAPVLALGSGDEASQALAVLCMIKPVCMEQFDASAGECMTIKDFCQNLANQLDYAKSDEACELAEICPDTDCLDDPCDVEGCLAMVCTTLVSLISANVDGAPPLPEMQNICQGEAPCDDGVAALAVAESETCGSYACGFLDFVVDAIGGPLRYIRDACGGDVGCEEDCAAVACAGALVPCVTYDSNQHEPISVPLGAPGVWPGTTKNETLAVAWLAGIPRFDVLLSDTEAGPVTLSGFDGYFIVPTMVNRQASQVSAELAWVGLDYRLGVRSDADTALTLVNGDAAIEGGGVVTAKITTKVLDVGDDLGVDFSMAGQSVSFDQGGIEPGAILGIIPKSVLSGESWTVDGKMERAGTSYSGDFPWTSTARSDTLTVAYNEIEAEITGAMEDLHLSMGLTIWGEKEWQAYADFSATDAPDHLELRAFGETFPIQEPTQAMALTLTSEIDGETGAHVLRQSNQPSARAGTGGAAEAIEGDFVGGADLTISFKASIRKVNFTVEDLMLSFELGAGFLPAPAKGVYLEANAPTGGTGDTAAKDLLGSATISTGTTLVEIAHLRGVKLEAGIRPFEDDDSDTNGASDEAYIQATATFNPEGYLTIGHNGVQVDVRGSDEDDAWSLSASVGVVYGAEYGVSATLAADLNPVDITLSTGKPGEDGTYEYDTPIVAFERFESVSLSLTLEVATKSVGIDITATFDDGKISVLPGFWEDSSGAEAKPLFQIHGILELKYEFQIGTEALKYASQMTLADGGGLTFYGPPEIQLEVSVSIYDDGDLCLDAAMDFPFIGYIKLSEDADKLNVVLGGALTHDRGACLPSTDTSFNGEYNLDEYSFSVSFGAVTG